MQASFESAAFNLSKGMIESACSPNTEVIWSLAMACHAMLLVRAHCKPFKAKLNTVRSLQRVDKFPPGQITDHRGLRPDGELE